MSPARSIISLRDRLSALAPGIVIAFVVAAAAHWLSEHYQAPAMLMALLLGIALNFLSVEGRCPAGIDFCARAILRFGVTLLGVRVSVELIAALGGASIVLVILGVIVTLIFGLLGARLFGQSWHFGMLTGGAVAICGASAAMAIAASLPKTDESERNLIFTVIGVTILSTVAMITYPLLSAVFDFDSHTAGLFLGGTIHDVAQVVGAGFSVDSQAGETATLVKMIRVTMLAPVVLGLVITLRVLSKGDGQSKGQRPPLLPLFVIGFILLALLNSFGQIPPLWADRIQALSKGALLVAMAAVGMKTSLKWLLDVGIGAMSLLVAETIFLALFITGGILLLG